MEEKWMFLNDKDRNRNLHVSNFECLVWENQKLEASIRKLVDKEVKIINV